MKQLVLRASERFLTLQYEKLLHRNAGKGGEGGRIRNKGETLLVTPELLFGYVSNGIGWVEGSGPRVVFALKLNSKDE
jgi:hypothetical protein